MAGSAALAASRALARVRARCRSWRLERGVAYGDARSQPRLNLLFGPQAPASAARCTTAGPVVELCAPRGQGRCDGAVMRGADGRRRRLRAGWW